MPASTQSTRKNVVLLVVLLAAQLLLMSLDSRQNRGVATVESVAMRVSSPFVAAARWVAGLAGDAGSETRSLFDAHRENERLEAELRRLKRDLQRTREAAAENERLRDLLEMRRQLEPRSVAASVVTSRVTGESRVIVIDRGASDGVRLDAAVVAWGGAVGRVVSVSGGYAKVQLLVDPSSGVAGVLQRGRAQGQVQGTGGPFLNMLFVPRFSDVIHGDRVVTSGLEGIFPRGYGIGRVVGIQESPAEGTQQIRLEPEVPFDRLEEVLVLLDRPADPDARSAAPADADPAADPATTPAPEAVP